jgi:hypothetical protein
MFVEVMRHRLVGDEHELFDDAVRHVSLGGDNLLDHPFVVQHDFRLFQVEVDRPAAVTPPVEDFKELAHGLEQSHETAVPRGDLRVMLRQDRVDVAIGHARVAVDDAVMKFVADDLPAAVDLHQTRLHEPIDVRPQAAQAGRELRREHVHGALREIHRRAALVRLPVQHAALGDVVRHVRDVDAEPVMPVREPLERDRVVEITRVLAVDGHGHERTEIGPAAQVAFADLGPEPRGLLDRFRGVLVGDAVLANDDFGIDAGFVDVAEHFDHASERTARGRGPAGDLDGHHVTGLRIGAVARRNVHVHDDAAVERHHEAEPGLVHVKPADNGRAAALEDPDDASLGALVGHALDARDDAIAVDGLIQVAAGDVQVTAHIVDSPIRHDEAEAARMGCDAPHDQVHPIREPEALTPCLNEGAVGNQVLEQALERGPLLARYLQALHQFAHRRGVLDPVADEREHLIVIQHLLILGGRRRRRKGR